MGRQAAVFDAVAPEDEIRFRDTTGVFNGAEGLRPAVIQVEIDVFDRQYLVSFACARHLSGCLCRCRYRNPTELRHVCHRFRRSH